MYASELYLQRTRKRQLYNIMPIANIPSVIQNGILSYYSAQRVHHMSVAMNEIQIRRENVKIPNGLKLHQYANLYFSYNNPMLYKRKDQADELCILSIASEVLNLLNVVVSDMNASAAYVRFYSPYEGINQLDFDKIFAQYWTHDEYYESIRHKAIKCAEVLVPNCIDYAYVTGACVKGETQKQELIELGFDKTIIVNPRSFY